jgi:hypothetical protein
MSWETRFAAILRQEGSRLESGHGLSDRSARFSSQPRWMSSVLRESLEAEEELVSVFGLGSRRRSKTQHRCLAKAVTKIKYSRLKLRRRSEFDTLNMKKWFLVLGVVFTLGMLTPQSSNAGIFIGFPIPIPVFYGPHYYVGPGYYYPPGYYWGPYGYAYYPHPYWRHRYWRYHRWYYY